MTEFGPTSGQGGDPFDDTAPLEMEIGALIIRNDNFVDAIQVLYRNPTNGQLTLKDQHGGNGGNQTIIVLDAGEFITEISGRYARFVDSLTITTSQGRRFGRFGGLGQCHLA